jgi:molybdopterin/thiamine biosynthesis adenylyltransferase
MLTPAEKAIYEWQMWVPGIGEIGQQKLKDSSVLITRCGGLGGLVAYELAAAGVGKLVIAHAGDLKPSDLHRQLLMTADWVGKPRIESIVRRLGELNPLIEVVGVPENVNDDNVADLVGQVDIVVDCAPLFEERLLLNRETVRQGKPMVECAMYELQFHITTFLPGTETPCLACLHPEEPPAWKREFPVFGAVSGTVGCMGAMEAIKLITGIGEPLAGRLLTMDLRDFKVMESCILRRKDCAVCGN